MTTDQAAVPGPVAPPRTAVADRPDLPASSRARTSRPGLTLAVLLTGQFMALLDVGIVNVAVPTIRTDLGASGAALQLVISGYVVSYAVLLITGARLGERRGFDRMFRAGLAVFTVASLACGLAPSAGTLIGFRVVQGAGAALMMPQVMSLIQRTFVGPARLKALGAYTAVLASGIVAGQLAGGVLVSADVFGWQWRPVFLLNVPIGVALLVAARRLLPPSRGDSARPLDLTGLVTLALAIGLLVVPLVLGHEEGWQWWTAVMLAGSATAFVAFTTLEARVAGRGGHPLIHRRVLRAPGLAPAAVTIFLVMTGVGGFMFAFALHLQMGLGQSALRLGLTLAPMAAGFGLGGLWWRRLPQRWHALVAAPALLAVAAGYVVLGHALAGGSGVSAPLEVMMAAMGLLNGVAYGQVFASALTGVATSDAADASGVMVTLIQLGQVIGVAGIGSLFLASVDGGGSGHAVQVAAFGVAAVTLAAAVTASFRPRAVQP